jgi:hypothetical protein
MPLCAAGSTLLLSTSRLSTLHIDEQLSLSEIAGPALAKIEYPERESKIQFQNHCNRITLHFYFIWSKCAGFSSQERKLSSRFGRTAMMMTMI